MRSEINLSNGLSAEVALAHAAHWLPAHRRGKDARARLVVIAALLHASCSPANPPPVSSPATAGPEDNENSGKSAAGSVEQAQPKEVPKGHLVLIGGGKKPDDVMRRFVELAGGATGRLVVLPMASEDSRAAGEEYRALLAQYGATTIDVIHIDSRESAPDATAAIDRATGVFFTGGDQRRIAERVVDTPMHQALRRLYERGGAIGGTSAGTACQSEIMLTGDGRLDVIEADNVITARGLGFTPGVIVDQHFVARNRNNRLISVVLEHPQNLGMGIDEATAAWFKPDGTMEVLGEGWVIVYDASAATIISHPQNKRLGAVGMKEHVLIAGHIFDLRTRTVTGAPAAAAVRAKGATQVPAQTHERRSTP